MSNTTDTMPPGSLGLPFIGETLQFLLDEDFAVKRHAKHGPVFQSHILGKPTVFMVGPEAARTVLNTQFANFSAGEGCPEAIKELLGESLFVQDGDEHKRNRALIAPALEGRALGGYFDTMNAIVEAYLAKWTGREFAWIEEFRKLTFEITSQLLLGAAPEDVDRLSVLFSHMTAGLLAVVRSRLPWTSFGRAVAARDEITRYVEAVVRRRADNPTNDALSLLLQSRDEQGGSLSIRQVTKQAMLLLFAGHETTTSMITCFCLEISRHPEILRRLREEARAVIGAGPIGYEHVKDHRQLPYLDQVLREVERRHPPVIGGFRAVTKTCPVTGFRLPAGTRVHYNIPATHRVAAGYADQDRFDPDRFGPGREEHKQEPFSLIGFSGGPRICIGMAFSKMEMRLIAAHLLRKHQWDLLPDQNLAVRAFPSRGPKDGLRVYFRRWHQHD